MGTHLTPPDRRKEALLAIDRAMVRIRRSQTRRTLGRLMQQELKPPVNLAHSFVVDALDEANGVAGDEPSVGGVAERLGIDPSRASRMVAGAIRAGYVKRVPSQADGRRSSLELTASGRKLLLTARRFRTQFFGKIMAGWSEQECTEFARLMTKFTDPLE